MISSHRPIKPQTSASVADVVSYLGSFEMFKAAAPQPATHDVEVVWTPNNHGYPYLAKCSCGWAASRRYAAEHAAKDAADDHVSAV
ncbi:hypothetical protein SEA_PARI_90 [Mycobacterium phage Pari]|nr:hypothetical protein Lockley_89 [Mycobacterium phage Lockley]YP_009205127.1 hypothetical protein AVU88_gp07 [Mycobacterium phage Pari]ACE79926.1 hypothetical protein Lockley_89 [Mycobacterium phage Lockley]ALH46851.1 hypothetical protein SEA_PARI_90 [Mycobacterium phage Pari]